jgi:hypothetical protein
MSLKSMKKCTLVGGIKSVSFNTDFLEINVPYVNLV